MDAGQEGGAHLSATGPSGTLVQDWEYAAVTCENAVPSRGSFCTMAPQNYHNDRRRNRMKGQTAQRTIPITGAVLFTRREDPGKTENSLDKPQENRNPKVRQLA